MRGEEGEGGQVKGMAADGISDGTRNKMENQHENENNICMLTRFKELLSRSVTPLKLSDLTVEQQRIQ